MSSGGGKIFLEPAISLARNLFRSRNSLLVTSSLRCASQLSSRVSISSRSSSFWSSLRPATHLALSNVGAGDSVRGAEPLVEEETTLGAPKKDVMLALPVLAFLLASTLVAALRLSVEDMVSYVWVGRVLAAESFRYWSRCDPVGSDFGLWSGVLVLLDDDYTVQFVIVWGRCREIRRQKRDWEMLVNDWKKGRISEMQRTIGVANWIKQF